jgi:hypothetical protein
MGKILGFSFQDAQGRRVRGRSSPEIGYPCKQRAKVGGVAIDKTPTGMLHEKGQACVHYLGTWQLENPI